MPELNLCCPGFTHNIVGILEAAMGHPRLDTYPLYACSLRDCVEYLQEAGFDVPIWHSVLQGTRPNSPEPSGIAPGE